MRMSTMDLDCGIRFAQRMKKRRASPANRGFYQQQKITETRRPWTL